MLATLWTPRNPSRAASTLLLACRGTSIPGAVAGVPGVFPYFENMQLYGDKLKEEQRGGLCIQGLAGEAALGLPARGSESCLGETVAGLRRQKPHSSVWLRAYIHVTHLWRTCVHLCTYR